MKIPRIVSQRGNVDEVVFEYSLIELSPGSFIIWIFLSISVQQRRAEAATPSDHFKQQPVTCINNNNRSASISYPVLVKTKLFILRENETFLVSTSDLHLV